MVIQGQVSRSDKRDEDMSRCYECAETKGYCECPDRAIYNAQQLTEAIKADREKLAGLVGAHHQPQTFRYDRKGRIKDNKFFKIFCHNNYCDHLVIIELIRNTPIGDGE